MRELVRMLHGSRLYGTAGPDSDEDYAGVFMPSVEEVLLGRIPKGSATSTGNDGAKNGPGDVDVKLYSLHGFLDLACAGETVALDMLHAGPEAWLGPVDPLWRELHERRREFHTRNLRALVGYARRQAAKYGIKGSRLAEAERALAFVRGRQGRGLRLRDLWAELPVGEHARTTVDEAGRRMWSVCERLLQETVSVDYAGEVLANLVASYGARARAAKTGQGVDWKAVSHALRAGFEVRAILAEGDFAFPLAETNLLREVKAGARPYPEVAERLEALLDELEGLSAASALPERVDRKGWDRWLADKVRTEVLNDARQG